MANTLSTLEGGYDPAFFDTLASVEDRHFWFTARNRLIYEVASRLTSALPAGYLVMEVGCGTGNVLRFLQQACPNGTVIGVDLWFEGLAHARRRTTCGLVQADMQAPPFARPFDVVGMFDVLEHLPDDRKVLTDVRSLLVPGGSLLLTVPAHQSLWSYFDEAAHHCRRYAAAELRAKLEAAGYHIEFLTEFMSCTFPLVWLTRKLAGVGRSSDGAGAQRRALQEFRIVPVVNTLLSLALRLEAGWVARGHSLPVGTSLLAVARRAP